MSDVSPTLVKQLREKTNAGMMDCKKALTEAGGDFEKAIEILRKKGQKVAANRSDREAKEGVVIAKARQIVEEGAELATGQVEAADPPGITALRNDQAVLVPEEPSDRLTQIADHFLERAVRMDARNASTAGRPIERQTRFGHKH